MITQQACYFSTGSFSFSLISRANVSRCSAARLYALMLWIGRTRQKAAAWARASRPVPMMAIDRVSGRAMYLAATAETAAVRMAATASRPPSASRCRRRTSAVVIGGGGAAGLNALTIAERLGCKRLVLPEVGAALSAFGAVVSDIAREYRRVFVTGSVHFDRDGAAVDALSKVSGYAIYPVYSNSADLEATRRRLAP